jgi:hypothetical protein
MRATLWLLVAGCAIGAAPEAHDGLQTARGERLIRSATADTPVVCLGEPVTVTVDAPPPQRGTEVSVLIDGALGVERVFSFDRPGLAVVDISAETVGRVGGELIESGSVEIEVESCVSSCDLSVWCGLDRFGAHTLECAARCGSGMDPDTDAYTWSWGDGTETKGGAYEVHSFGEAMDHAAMWSPFEVSVAQLGTGEVASHTFRLGSLIATAAEQGVLMPLIQPPSASALSCPIVVPYTVHNPHDVTLSFERYVKTYHPCDTGAMGSTVEASALSVFGDSVADQVAAEGWGTGRLKSGAGTVVLAPGETIEGTLEVGCDSVPDHICVVSYDFLGEGVRGASVHGSLWVEVARRAAPQPDVAPAMLEFLQQLRDLGLVDNPHRITDEDLHRLESQRRIQRTSDAWEVI